ncbi:transmembrane 9 superfamily member 2-like isoform X2 [Thalassophryne amazonica]|uniref:transmembrane 9 superfamily member 2-like isoform X2 n=1 Tax=Thalassophryne amazonica TaxID=390379 RepID=UPI0014709165|nr:transmembrane 9 superfamily member 2-like isoform X2 [Thalassophryne amazonica]
MAMQLNYQHHWIIDDLPVTWCYDVEDGRKYCSPGFPIGCLITSDGRAKDACVISFNRRSTFYIFNHVNIRIIYNSRELEGSGGVRLVSANLEPMSIKHLDLKAADCGEQPMGILVDFDDVSITYSYSLLFEENNNINWASRWDYIGLPRPHTDLRWFRFEEILLCGLRTGAH